MKIIKVMKQVEEFILGEKHKEKSLLDIKRASVKRALFADALRASVKKRKYVRRKK